MVKSHFCLYPGLSCPMDWDRIGIGERLKPHFEFQIVKSTTALDSKRAKKKMRKLYIFIHFLAATAITDEASMCTSQYVVWPLAFVLRNKEKLQNDNAA